MGNSLRKGISIFLSMIIVTSFFMGAVADSAFAAESGMSTFQTPSVIQLVKVEASEITNTVELEYYLNTGEGREFIQEDVEICSDRYIITTSRTKVNGTGELEASPKETSVFSYPRENGDEGLTTFDDESEISLFKATAPTPYSKTISLRGAKFTVASVATLIASVLGVSSAGAFVKVASVMISYWIGAGTNVVPDSVYFSGTRTVSKSSGKIFNRYKGTFYADSSMRKSFGSASWSKRWGH